jgi:hypothetical protein
VVGSLGAAATLEQCAIRLGPERDRVTVRAAEDLQAVAGVPYSELGQLVSKAAQNARGADCDIARANMTATVDDLLRKPKAVTKSTEAAGALGAQQTLRLGGPPVGASLLHSGVE